LNEKDLEEFITLSATQGESENSWSVNVKDIDKTTCDLTAINPNKIEELDNRTPQEILAEIKALDEEVADAISAIEELL
jgi:type I restriction enzyme M protein